MEDSKIFKLINMITGEYIISTSIYLLSLFSLSLANSLNLINIIYWIIIFSFIFDKFLLKKPKLSKKYTKEFVVGMLIRIFFIVVNILAFGINIVSLG